MSSATTSSPDDATQTQTHVKNIHAVLPISIDDTATNTAGRQQQLQQPIQKVTLLSTNNHASDASATVNVNVNAVQSVVHEEEKNPGDKILQGENQAKDNQREESLRSGNNYHSEKETECTKKIFEQRSAGLGMSPTTTMATSSSLSLQGPGPALKPMPKSKHGFGIHVQTQVNQSSAAPIQPSSQDLMSTNNVTTKGMGDAGVNVDDISNKNGPATEKERQQSLKSGPPTNNMPKDKKVKSRNGRPRSNSVPFDFQSTVVKPQSKSTSPNGKSGNLRRGKWTVEEEAYVARVIQDFNSGYLNAPPGTTLRTYLSDKLNCDPMRITKKFTGDACIGKRVFHPAVRCSNNAALIDKAQVCK